MEFASLPHDSDPDRFLLPENPAFWPRPATPQEREQFALYKEHLIGSDVAADLAATTYLAVFPQYQTDTPRYSGKVMVAIYGGSPDQVETFTWMREEIIVAHRDHD
jgi:hypothetical protein